MNEKLSAGDSNVPPKFILASASPRRRQLLNALGLFPEIIPANVVEHEDSDSCPRKMVEHNATLKARDVSKNFPDALVLGSDTTVALDDVVLNKPADLARARAMLKKLSGREHTVFTGVCLTRKTPAFFEYFCVTSRVKFKMLSDDAITRYFEIVNPLDKAGAYGIQEGRDIIIERYDEPVSNIMGLPAERVAERLRALGLTGIFRK